MSSLSTRRSATLGDALLVRRDGTATWRTDALLIVLFSAFVALTARVKLDLGFTPVPITGQTLGVLLTGALLGGRRGTLALALYLAEGAVGLPVFAGGTSGFARLLGPTGGYLLSYPLAAGLVGLLAERGWDRTPLRAALAMLLGNIVIYLIGVPWLSWYSDTLFNVSVVWAGVLPYLPGDIIKLAVAASVLPGGWTILNRTR